MTPPLINESLRVLRLYWGRSQADLSRALGISQSYLSEIESGHKEVTLDLLTRYSKELNVPLSRLLFFAEEMDGAPPMRGRVFIAGKTLDILKKLLPEDA